MEPKPSYKLRLFFGRSHEVCLVLLLTKRLDRLPGGNEQVQEGAEFDRNESDKN